MHRPVCEKFGLERYLKQHRPQNAPAETVALDDILL
jgi:hypothetical protein